MHRQPRRKGEVSSAANLSLTEGRQELPEDSSNGLQAGPLRASSQEVRVQSIPREAPPAGLRRQVVPALPVAVPDLARVQDSARRVPGALEVHGQGLAALRHQQKPDVRSARRRVALAAAASSIPRRKKAR